MLRIAAVSGARRAELAALQWTDLRDEMLTIDSAIEVVSSGDRTRVVRDAATKTANTRTVTVDQDIVTAIEALRLERELYGPWMFGLGPELVSPDRIGWWWKRARTLAGINESGGFMTCATGPRRSPSARATTSAPSPAASATRTRR